MTPRRAAGLIQINKPRLKVHMICIYRAFKYKVPMPNQNLSDQEIRGYIKHFRFLDNAPKESARAAAKK